MALLLPLLAFLCILAVDFARIFYFSLTVANCARNGAVYASDAYVREESPYQSVEEAALADASNLTNPAPTVSSTTGADVNGNPYAEVTVTYPFSTITRFPGIPNTVTLSRTVRMSLAPPNPK
jgi:Flp pilus assembly protein TadG